MKKTPDQTPMGSNKEDLEMTAQVKISPKTISKLVEEEGNSRGTISMAEEEVEASMILGEGENIEAVGK